MTDKQIIINDYFNIMRDENGRLFGIQEIGDIRQLIKDIREQNEYIQTKEQECEELKEKYKWYDHYKEQALYNKNLCNEKSEQLDRLKAENKRLQKEREKAKNYNLEYGQLLIKATNKNNKLSKTLTEIKEIAEAESYLSPQSTRLLVHNILQKISEVEND